MRRLAPWLLLLASQLAVADERHADVTVKGSDTIGGELGPALAKGWEALHPGKRVVWQSLGSKTAFVGLFDGSADIGASSRTINGDELKQAGQLGVKLQEIVIAYDGLAIIVHPSNRVPALTVSQLSDLYAGHVTNWKELGGDDLAIEAITRPTYSGTRSFFDERALRRGDPNGTEKLAPRLKTLETNEQVVPYVAQHAGAIAYVGLAALSKEVRVVPVALIPGGPARLPESADVRNGTYPLYRPLYLYSRASMNTDAAGLMRFALTPSGQDIVKAVGFVRVDSGGEVRVTDRSLDPPAVDSSAPPLRIFFKHNGTSLSAEAKKQLTALAASLSATQKLLVVGHTDGKGNSARDLSVSRARAAAVVAYLRTLSIDEARLELKAAGATAPIASNDTTRGREQNRRVDIYIVRRE
jgi:phosphate binding protein